MSFVIPPRQSRFFGPFITALGVVGVGVGVWGLVSGSGPFGMQALAALVPATLGLLLALGGRMITQRRGGVAAESDAIVLFGDSATDRVQIPLKRFVAVCTLRLVERWGDNLHERWVIEGIVRDAPRVLLGESDDEHGLKHVAHQLTQAARLRAPVTAVPNEKTILKPNESTPAGIETTPTGVRISVGLGGHLAATLGIGGVSMALVGSILLADLVNNNVFGFLFGPFLIALGLVLVAVPVVKSKLSEELVLSAGQLNHVYSAFGRYFSRTEVPLEPDTYVRVRQRGLQGANLEVVTGGRIIHVAGGVHSTTTVDPPALFWLGQYLRWIISNTAKAPPTPLPEPMEGEAESETESQIEA